MKNIISLVFLLLISGLNAQTAALDKACLKYLGVRANSLDVTTYATRVDEMDASIVVLTKQANLTKGVLFFPQGNQAYYLTGSDSILYTVDTKGWPQGKLAYSTRHQTFDGILSDAQQPKMLTIHGQLTHDVPVTPPTCYVDKWIVAQKGLIDDEPIYLYLQRLTNGEIQGTVYFTSQKAITFVTGIISEDNHIDLVVANQQGERVGDIYAQINMESGLLGQFTDYLGTQKKFESTPFLSEQQNCYSEINSNYSYSIIYPILKINEFDGALSQWSSEWIKSCKKQAQKKQTKVHGLLSAPTAFSYVKVHCFDKNIFSGYQISYLPQTGRYQLRPINFDFKDKVFLQLSDLFESETLIKNMAKNKTRKNINKHPLQKFDGFQQWVQNMEFSNFVIQPDGILFSSDFHPTFGQYYVLLPFSDLKDYYKNKKLIKRFRKPYK